MDAKSQGLLEELRDNPNPFTGLGICFAAGHALAEIELLRKVVVKYGNCARMLAEEDSEILRAIEAAFEHFPKEP